VSETPARGKVYIAGSSKEISRVRKWIAALRAAGYEITCDWTIDVEAAQKLGRLPTDEEAIPLAIMDMNGVLNATILWMLRPDTESTGVHSEIGIALGWNEAIKRFGVGEERLVTIASGGNSKNIFSLLADRVFATDEEAFEHLTNW